MCQMDTECNALFNFIGIEIDEITSMEKESTCVLDKMHRK